MDRYKKDKNIDKIYRNKPLKFRKKFSLDEFTLHELIVNEILNLNSKKLLNGCANITGGGLADNIKRVIPDGLCAEINLDKIKPLEIFRWLKKQNISEKEMLKTFNCGVGFCIIINPKNFKKILKFFPGKYKPYPIGKIISNSNKIKFHDKINWG